MAAIRRRDAIDLAVTLLVPAGIAFLAIGLLYNVAIFAVLVGIAILRFERKDILS